MHTNSVTNPTHSSQSNHPSNSSPIYCLRIHYSNKLRRYRRRRCNLSDRPRIRLSASCYSARILQLHSLRGFDDVCGLPTTLAILTHPYGQGWLTYLLRYAVNHRLQMCRWQQGEDRRIHYTQICGAVDEEIWAHDSFKKVILVLEQSSNTLRDKSHLQSPTAS